MDGTEDERRVWDSIYEREQTRQESIEELKKAIKEAGESMKTPKSLFKLVLFGDGIKASEAADILGVKMTVIDRWTKTLHSKNLVEVEGANHPNPTIKPTIEVLEKYKQALSKNKELRRERQLRAKLEEEVEEKTHMLEDIEAKLLAEKKIRAKLEDRLKAEEDELKAEEDKLLDKAASDMLGEVPAGETGGVDLELDSGATYLLHEEKPRKSVNLFIRELKKGLKGLYITRSNPKQVRTEYDLGDSSVYWLTRVKTGDDTYAISGIHELSILISNFIDENKNGVVLLDGIEYLVSNTDFPMVLRLIQQMRDKVSTSESKMLIPVNPEALDSKQLTLLERECRTIK